MPEPVKRNQRYMPGLDGLRAIAVLAVIVFHLGFDWAPGGLLGVGIFFTLSGYLITDLLLAQLAARGKIKLGSFWLARARRLLPALFVMLAIVLAWVTIFGPAQPDQFRKAVVSAIFYVNNWQQIFGDVSYFARFAPEGPLNHLWSLSVEEQFYIVWPFLLLLGVKVVRERPLPSGVRPRLALLTLALALVSTIEMAILYHPTLDPSRIYYGTDTRAGGLLFGAALAMVWPSRRLSRRITIQARNLLDGLGVLGLVIIAIMIWQVGEFDSFLYQGGFVVLSLATVMVLMPLAHPACRLGVWLGVRPLRWVGVRSYAIYLWQTPIIILTAAHAQNPQDESLLRKLLQVAAIFGISALSWKFIEEPIRHGAIGRFFARRRAVGWKWETFAPPMRGVIIATGLILVIGVAGMAGLNAASAEGEETRVKEATAAGTTKPPPLTKKQAAESTKTSCKAVVHIGDSTSEGLDSAEYLPLENQRIPSRYEEVGVKEVHMQVSGRALDRRAVRRRTQRPGSRRGGEGRRLRRLLGAGAGDQRGGQRCRRLQRRRARTDRQDDGDHRRRTGTLGKRPFDRPAGRSILGPEHEEVGRRTGRRLFALSQHADLQLGRRRQRRMVHRRRDPLHLTGLRCQGTTHRPGAGPRVSSQREVRRRDEKLPRKLSRRSARHRRPGGRKQSKRE